MMGPGQAILGLGMVLGAAAELLDKRRIRAASLLRSLAITLAAVSLSVVIAGL